MYLLVTGVKVRAGLVGACEHRTMKRAVESNHYFYSTGRSSSGAWKRKVLVEVVEV